MFNSSVSTVNLPLTRGGQFESDGEGSICPIIPVTISNFKADDKGHWVDGES